MEEIIKALAFQREHKYKVVARSNPIKMMKWVEPYEIQALAIHHFQRVGAIGDGNCLLHSFLYATSPTYRSHTNPVRQELALGFRKHLATRVDELNALAAEYYGEDRGGAIVIEESMNDLVRSTHAELGVEFVPILGKLFHYNLLAVQKQTHGRVRPVRNTFDRFDPSLPTVVINYVGAGLDFGHADYETDGHYEPVVWSEADMVVSSAPFSSEKKNTNGKSRRLTKKKAKEPKMITLPASTLYEFAPGAPELEPMLELFRTPSEGAEYQQAAALEAAARARAATPITEVKPTRGSSGDAFNMVS